MAHEKDRDTLIAWTLLPFLIPSRLRLLVSTFNALIPEPLAPVPILARMLGITGAEAQLLRDPLAVPKLREAVKTIRDECLVLVDEDYPPLLRELVDPPLALRFRGRRELAGSVTSLAIVGSRRASPYAINVAGYLAKELSSRSIPVVSGLARGVDTAAHQTTLTCGGATVAVLGNGLDIVYPRENRRLYEAIATDGLLLSEHPAGTPPRKEHFPRRNRIIAGMTRGTIVVEATSRSGSLITARLAAEEGREVFCVPGSIFSPGSEGTHRLIQYGAKLVHHIGDVLDELPQPPRTHPTPASRPLLALLDLESGTHIDEIIERSGLSRGETAASLLSMEVEGLIRALPGARYVRNVT